MHPVNYFSLGGSTNNSRLRLLCATSRMAVFKSSQRFCSDQHHHYWQVRINLKFRESENFRQFLRDCLGKTLWEII